MASLSSRFGPGLLVTAAFVGPGTITTASIAGAGFGYALLWAIGFSLLATWVLQEMSARLGLVTRRGLAESIREAYPGRLTGLAVTALIVAAVGIGNAAYQAGNITGAALALGTLSGTGTTAWALVVGTAAGGLLWSGRYALVETALVLAVLVMSIVFLLTLAMVQPPVGDILGGLFTPAFPPGSALTLIALVGTTVVPYNLFLHASAVQQKWTAAIPLRRALRESRLDAGLSIGIGGLITMAVLCTSASAFFATGTELSPANLAQQLEPLLGRQAPWLFGGGLFAAGLSSAITAPLAGAYAVCGVMGWSMDLRGRAFRATWLAILGVGTTFAALGHKPLTAILFAQAANGFLLPLCAIVLLLMMNRRSLLGQYSNRAGANLAGAVVVVVSAGLGGWRIFQALAG